MNKTPTTKIAGRVAIIGVGMIGGSFIRSLKNANLVEHVTGVDTNKNELKIAKGLGIIDSQSTINELENIDTLIIATPVGSMQSIFFLLKKKSFIKKALITDVGSTKQSVINAATEGLGYLPENFVPSHPIAGREHIGVENSEDEMFVNHRAILTPHENSSPSAVAAIQSLWEACGASVDVMTAKNHDRILAATSHLPHVLAYGLMESLGTTEYEEPIFEYAAGGFKSFTRTASSNPVMWRDVCLNNKDDILYWLDHYQKTLLDMRNLIEQTDGESLLDIFQRSKSERDKHLVSTSPKSNK